LLEFTIKGQDAFLIDACSAITLLRVGTRLVLFSLREAERRHNRISFGEASRRLVPAKNTSRGSMDRASPKGADAPKIQDILQKALSLLRAGEADHALACLITYPHLTHGHPFACYLAGLIYVNTGNDI
jgi:hypothetical protein